MPRNEVKTLLSKQSVFDFEWIINWLWDEDVNSDMTECLMKMLECYVEEYRKDENRVHIELYPQHRPEMMINVVSHIIQLKERLNEIVNIEKVYNWKYNNTDDCWCNTVETKM